MVNEPPRLNKDYVVLVLFGICSKEIDFFWLEIGKEWEFSEGDLGIEVGDLINTNNICPHYSFFYLFVKFLFYITNKKRITLPCHVC
jgi:hypothetical protein